MMTTPQILNQSKTVTRRLGWEKLKVGDKIQAVEKGMGLKKGKKVKRLAVLEVVNVRRERLSALVATFGYGLQEVGLEGFPEMLPSEFVKFFCASNKGATAKTEVTRIEFRYVK